MAAPQTPERGSGLSVTAFVLGLVGFLPPLALAAVVVGVVALVRRQTMRPLAIAGLVLGLVWTAGSIAFWSSGMPARIGEAVSAALEEAAEPGDSDEFAWALPGGMPVGACLNDSTVYQQPWDEATTAEQIDEVDCSQPHDLEVYELAILPDGEYPGDWEIEELAYDACIAAFEPFIGVPYARSEIEIFYYYPLQASWEYADDREVVCTVTDFEGPTTGTLKGADR